MDEKKKGLLKKLQALAERGVSGEKEGAQKKLKQLMKKYGIEEADISEDKEEDYDFRYHDNFERKLLLQLFFKIVPDYKSHVYVYKSGKGSRSTYIIRCTKAQALQLQVEYDFYCELWKEEVNFFMKAFIQKHKIFAITDKEENMDINPLSIEEIMSKMRQVKRP